MADQKRSTEMTVGSVPDHKPSNYEKVPVAMEPTVTYGSTSSVKSEPPKFVRREKRSNGEAGTTTKRDDISIYEAGTTTTKRDEISNGEVGTTTTTTKRGEIIAQQRRSRRQSGEQPEVVPRPRLDSGDDETRYDGSDEMTTTDSDERSPTTKTSPVVIEDQTVIPATKDSDECDSSTLTSDNRKSKKDNVEDDVIVRVYDYTYMYKKTETSVDESGSDVRCSTTCTCSLRNDDTSGTLTNSTSPPLHARSATPTDFRSPSVPLTVADDISSMTTSIVDYVRRSLSEAGVKVTEEAVADDDKPPPLPMKTAIRHDEQIHYIEHSQHITSDDLMTNSAWEPTHMSWDEVLIEAQMLGIPLFRPRSGAAQSDCGRRSSLSSASSTMSYRSTPTSSPARHQVLVGMGGSRLQSAMTTQQDIITGQFKTVKRGSSTPGSIGVDGNGSNRRESAKLTTTSRTGKFNLKNLLAKLAGGGKLKDSTSPEHHRNRHHATSASMTNVIRRSKPDDLQSVELCTRSTTLCRRSMSQPDQHKARSLSASGTGSGLRRAKINDSNTSVSSVSQYYPTAVACRRQAAAVAAAGCRRLSPSSGGGVGGPASVIGISCCDDIIVGSQFGTARRVVHHADEGPATAPPSIHMSLRRSAVSVLTTDWSMPGSASTNSLGSVFSMSSHSTPWTSSYSAASDSGHRGSSSPQCCTLGTPVHTTRNHHHVSPTHGSNRQPLTKNIQELNQCYWYWGSVGWEVAETRLATEPDGSFLLRDSSDDHYLYSLSFCALGSVHHTRIEHYKGMFSFSAQSLRVCSGESSSSSGGQLQQLTASSIVEFVHQAMIESHRCREGQSVYSLQPKPPGLFPIPVRLLYPISRPQEHHFVVKATPVVKEMPVGGVVDVQADERPCQATTHSVKVDVH